MTMNNKVTIKDIAELSGLSKTTVSRYINGQEHLMSEESRQKLKRIIEQVEYKPSAVARSLKSKKTNTIGVIVADISSPWSASVIGGIGDVLLQKQYMPIIANAGDSVDQEHRYIDFMLEREVDGLIVNTSSSDNPYLISLAEQGVPIVLCDRNVDGHNFDIVRVCNEDMMYTAITHLKARGFTRLGFFTAPYKGNSTRYERVDGFRRLMGDYFKRDASNDVYVFESGAELDLQLKCFMDSIEPGEIPAIFAVNSVSTVQVYQAIKRAHLRIPQDVGLCGPDDWGWDSSMNWTNLVSIGITTMDIDSRKAGETTARLMLDRIEKPSMPSQHRMIVSHLTERASTQR